MVCAVWCEPLMWRGATTEETNRVSSSAGMAGAGLVGVHDSAPQHSASDALAGMMMKGAVKCDKQVEEQ